MNLFFSKIPVTAFLVGLAIFNQTLAKADESENFNRKLLIYFQPLPKEFASEENPITEKKVSLGRQLFYDTRLSLNGKISCNSCHALDTYGVDRRATSVGFNDQLGNRNSPTVYNSALHVAQFWDGRSANVEEQAKGPILNPVEMAMPSANAVVDVLETIPGYVEAFRLAFPEDRDPVTYQNLAFAIGAFERKLVTEKNRFDQLLDGKNDALSKEEKSGLETFVRTGCTACHSGAGLGGKLFQKLGLVRPWPKIQDSGREAITGIQADRHVFKVPSLRNIAMTGPYLHDGSISSLEEVTKLMAWHQLGQDLNDQQIQSIVAFLKSLTGELPLKYIEEPALPKNGPKTTSLLQRLRSDS